MALLLRFWPYVAGAALILGVLGFTYSRGRAAGAASVQAKYAKAAEHALAAMKRGQAKIDDLDRTYAATSATQQSTARTIYYETQRIIDRPVYRNLCVDSSGVGLLDRAADNANRPLAGFTPAKPR